MRQTLNRIRAIVIIAAAMIVAPALAHHSFSMFDREKEIKIEGTITKFQWSNPHVWIYLNVPDSKGKQVEWGIEHINPNTLSRQGWKRNTFQPGDKVLLIINPARDDVIKQSQVCIHIESKAMHGDPPAATNPNGANFPFTAFFIRIEPHTSFAC